MQFDRYYNFVEADRFLHRRRVLERLSREYYYAILSLSKLSKNLILSQCYLREEFKYYL